MVSYYAYWVFIFFVWIVDIMLIRKRGFQLIDFIMALSTLSASGIGDLLLSMYYKLYYYVDLNFNASLALFYHLFVYSTCGLWFSMFFPRSKNIKKVVLYSFKWIIFLLLMESVIIKPFGIIQYTGWKLHHSVIFFLITLPSFTFYYLIIDHYLEKDKINNKN
jgi:hypothetical protein